MNLICTIQIHRFIMDYDSCWKNQNKQNIMQVMGKQDFFNVKRNFVYKSNNKYLIQTPSSLATWKL